MAVSRIVSASEGRGKKPRPESPMEAPIHIGELSEFVAYALKRAQLRVFDDFIQCTATLQLTPAQFAVLMLIESNPGHNQTEIASTLGILRPNFVALLDDLESRGWCLRSRSDSDRRSHILTLTETGRGVLDRAKKLVRLRHEARLSEVLGEDNRQSLLTMLGRIAREF